MNHQPQNYSDQSDPTGGFSNKSLLIISLNGITILIVVLVFLYKRTPQTQDAQEEDIPYDQALQEADVSLLNRAQRRARAKLLMKKNRRLEQNEDQANAGIGPGPGVAALQGEELERLEGPVAVTATAAKGSQLSRKERQRAAKELEKMERKANDEQIRLQKQYQEEERKIRAMIQLEKKQQAELDKKEIQEREFKQWKYMFPEADKDTKVTVKEFLQELDFNPVISLRETAEEFNVTTDTLIQRLDQLETEGRICHGVLNQCRDEYIYISPANMANIAAFVEKKGTVTFGDLIRTLPQMVDDVEDDDIGDQGSINLNTRDKKDQ